MKKRILFLILLLLITSIFIRVGFFTSQTVNNSAKKPFSNNAEGLAKQPTANLALNPLTAQATNKKYIISEKYVRAEKVTDSDKENEENEELEERERRERNGFEEGEEEENDMYDGPGIAAAFEYKRTKDPATGKVPRERYMAALEQTIISKNNALSSRIGALAWQERGSNSDVPGPGGNSRSNNGVTSGRMRAMMVDSLDATHKTVWVGGVDGGLWKTTDITASPASWALINDNLSNISIAAICQDPRPGFQNIMYFCTGESYYNIDAVQGNGVFKSTDGGATWALLPSTTSYVNGTRILCDFQGNIYLATRGTGLLRSTAASGGAAWTNITPSTFPNSDICDLEISSTSAAGRLHVVCGIFTTQAYRYTDIPTTVTSAAGWTAPAAAFPSFANRAEICCSGSTLYALPADGTDQVPTIYKSTNGGANWAATGTQPAAGWASGQGWYSLACDIDPSSGGAACIVGGLENYKTTDGGATWAKISNWVGTTGQYVHADMHKILWYDGGNKLLFANDGGVFYSGDKGTTIRDRNIGLRLKQFYSVAVHPSTTNYFLAGAQDNGVHQFNNAGLSSSIEVTGGDGGYVAIDQNEPLFQFGSYVYNVYRRSTNGGSTWSTVTLNANTGQFINPFDYDNTGNIMYCGDAAGTYRRWTDPQTGSATAVVSITSLSTGSVTAVSVSPYTANRVYLGTDGGRVVRVDGANTIASGSAGTNLSTGLPAGATVNCINQGTDDLNLICCFSNYGVNNVWVSTNGGTSWTAIDGNLPDMPVRWCMFYPGSNTKAYIATETGVWDTDLINGASTSWAANTTFPAVRTDMLKYRPSDRTIAAATHGRGLWTAVIPTVSTPDLSFQYATASASEATAFTSGCRGYTDYTYSMVISNSPTGAATVTLAVVGGGTATQGVDYAVTTNGNFSAPSMVLTFPNGSGSSQPFTVRVYNDNAVESAENFTLNYSISGASNAQAGVSNQSFVVTINDNDAAPVANSSSSNSVGTYNANLTTQAPFINTQAKFRIQSLFTAAELNSAGITGARNFTSMTLRVVTKNSTLPFTGFTISMGNTTTTTLSAGFTSPAFTQVYSSNYSTVAGDNLFTFSTPFAWDGTSNIVVNFCYDNAAAGATADVVEGTTAPLGVGIRGTTYSNAIASSPCTAAASFVSDARIRATFGTTVAGTPIATALSSTNTAYLGPNDDVYFYDASGNILARIKNLTAFDYGCTQVIIDRAGSTSSQFWNATPANYLLSKSVKVIPTNNTASGHYQITLYYTAGEVTGWQTATGQVWANAQMLKVNNGFYIPDVTPAAPHVSDVTINTATPAAFGTQYNIMSDFNTTGFSGFGVGVPGSSGSCTIALTSAVGTNAQTVCTNTAITNISYSTTGATGATFSGLPAGVTGNWAANVVTISGTPSVSGTFNYTVTATGGTCSGVTATGSITVTANNTISLTSAVGTISQTVCINTAITNITYSTTGATGATFSGLPAGITGNWAANVVTISGTPTASGTFNYTVTLTGGCGTITATGSITVTANNTITLSSAVGTNAQTKCINTAITNITYSTTGATGATFSGLPAGVTGNWAANVVTVSGTPSVAGTFNYTVTLTGGCGTITATGSITVTANNTVSLTSAVGTNAQTRCINTAITNITYATTGATGATFSGLPAGVTGNWAANVVTISGTPTASGTFNYTVTLTGGCGTVTATGSITVTANNTITLSSAVGTNAQTKCINTAITNITYSTTGATGATFSGLPAGVTGNWAANVATISGTPTASGTFNYTVTLTGGCGTVTATGSITVTANNTITLSSAVGTNAQTKCINTAITNITYSTTGATGATFSGLPAGVTGNWAANVVTISGTPTASGTFNYTVTLTGGCGTVTATGSITVTANNTITLSSAVGTNAQTKCINTAITNITYSTTGATGATFSGLPAGVTGNWAANVATISGTPTASGTFNYTVTLTGGCGTVTATGSIIVTPNKTITLTSAVGTNAQTVNVNTAITNITYATTGATGATFSGLPAGVTGNWAANVVTISGTPTASGTFNYTVTLTGGCGAITATGSITVNSASVVTLNLTLFLQGFYTGPSTMQPNLFDLGLSADPTATDNITVNLWAVSGLANPNPGFSVNAVLHSNGTATVQFPATVNGNSYYIAVLHRNSIETWSKTVVAFTTTTAYNFSTALNKAYDDGVLPPMKNMGGSIFAFYAGDINGDGAIDSQDMNVIDNELGFFGYNVSDVNGDGATDAQDMNFVDNNSQLGLFYARP